jgi:hypothetical protein
MTADKYMCPNCQNEVSYGDKFCGKCGFQFGDWGSVSSATQPEQEDLSSIQNMSSTPRETEKKSSVFGTLLKWGFRLILAVVVIGFGVSFFDGATPQEAIKNGDREAVLNYYQKAKDKTKAKEEIGKAFLEEAYRILDDKQLKNSPLKLLEAGNKLTGATEFVAVNDDFKELRPLCSDFNKVLVAVSKATTASDDLWKKHKLLPTAGNIEQINGYILNKISNSETQYLCVDYEYILGNPIPKVDQEICVVEFAENAYVKRGVQTFYGIERHYEDFVDKAGFKTRLMVYRAVSQTAITDITKAKQAQEAREIREEVFRSTYPRDFSALQGKIADNAGNKGDMAVESKSNGQGAEATLRAFHKAITAKQFRAAFNCLGPGMQNYVGGYDKFITGYSTTISSTLTEMRTVSADNASAVIEYTLEAKDQLKSGISTQYFKGKANLQIINGEWKIVEVTARKI